MEIYPEMRYEIEKLKEKKDSEHQEFIYEKYFRKLLVDRKFREILDIIKPNEVIKSCYLVIGGEYIDCAQNSFHILQKGNVFIMKHTLLDNFNSSQRKILLNKGIEKNLEKIIIESMNFSKSFMYLNLIMNPFMSDKQIHFSSQSYHKLSPSQFRCKSLKNNRLIFSTNEVFDCRNDCTLSLINMTYGCLDFPIINHIFGIYIDIERHLSTMGYKICSTKISFNTTFESKVRKKCIKRCPECQYLLFQTNFLPKKDLVENKTVNRIEIIPDNSPHVKYIETLQIDFNQLIYTLGGIIGLWFGLSPKQIPDIFINLLHLLKALVNSLQKLLLQL